MSANEPLAGLLSDVKSGFASGEEVPDGIFQFRMNNITTSGHIDLSKKRRVPRVANVSTFLLEPGDVLFNATNSPELVGKSAFFPGNDEPSVFSNHFLRLRPKSEMLDGRYLARWLSLQFQRGVFRGLCKQWVNQATVGREALLSQRMPVPPLAEQRRIADILDRADALRAKRRAALAQLDTLTQSIFLDMFGEPASNPEGFERKTLGELIVAGPQNGLYKPATEYGDGAPIVRIDAFYDGVISDLASLKRVRVSQAELELYGLRLNDILINRVNSMAYLGKSALISELVEPTVFESNMMRLAVDRGRVAAAYVVEALQSDDIKRQIRSAAKDAVNQSSINQKDVAGFQILAPPLELQEAFVRRKAAIEAAKAPQRASLQEFDSLFACLQHRAFRGGL